MDYLVTCDGVPIGTVTIPVLTGLPHARLYANTAYESVRRHAILAEARLNWLAPRGTPGDFADDFARTWTGGRLALVDMAGDEIGVASVIIIDDTTPRVIIDARPDAARIGALIPPINRGGGRSRPAA